MFCMLLFNFVNFCILLLVLYILIVVMFLTLSYVIPVVYVTNEREESVVNQHN